ncbi:uncharacterized protein BP5553_05007 [Venustampulla echinocandica]|uniref:C3H1-type domain-containing protein n=1 Tax=Venustampulla echinocandica TaxID=2656787 RepID=A0A370TPX4_9HELO|nr:uncharacterized protein BP5553_05007 [Venustampulla echinocandica]RDL37574.1 hypothetical protein BP5553_05007 [Venustampulla echinocandica]
MEGNNGHGNGNGNGNVNGHAHAHAHAHANTYIQDDAAYNEVMNNAVWPGPGPGDQFLYAQHQQGHQPQPQQQPQPQDLYSRYATTQPQPSYEHYGLHQQPSYPSMEYGNLNPNSASPYVSHYQQHAGPSALFGQATSSIDPSLQTSAPSPYRAQDSSFSVAPSATISPQYLQYAPPPNQPVNQGVPTSAYQQPPANVMANTFSQPPQDHSTMYFNNVQNGDLHRTMAGAPIQYPPLPLETKPNEVRPAANHMDKISNVKSLVTSESPQILPRAQPAKPTQASNPLRMTHPELYASAGGQRLAYAPFIVFEETPIQITLGLKNTIPKYHPRKSKSGKVLIPGFASSRSSSSARSSAKKTRISKETKLPSSKWKGTRQDIKPAAGKLATPREDSSLGAGTKSTPTPTDSSSSEDESSSEEESEYEDEEEMTLVDVSTIRGTTRPTDDIPGAARWDAIGIIWRDPKSSPSVEFVKAAIEEYGNFLIELRSKLRANLKETDDAAGRAADLARLGAERGILLEALYQTIDAANVHGYDAIVENLGRYQKLVNSLTTTLIDCVKIDDYLGKLPRAVFSLLARFQTMTDDLLKKLKFDSIQKRWRKHGDAEINANIDAILANTVEAKERASKAQKGTTKVEKDRMTPEKTEKTKLLQNTDTNKPPAFNPAKRPHEGDSTNGKPSKKLATETSNTTIKAPPPKRNNLLGIASKPLPKPAVKKREISPPGQSKLGALLASIAKRPEPPKAPEAPPRPPETPEEKARRERKESRRHLRVKFKEGTELEEIRLFKHEQAEDEGRQDDMLRDAHDYRSEGIMHKRRVSEAMDEDDEIQSGEIESRPYPELVGVDLTGLEKSTPFGQKYTTRGGDLTFTTPEQQAQERREALELMTIYTDPNDIPPSPKEPPYQMDGPGMGRPESLLKEPSAPWLAQRLQEIKQYGPDYASQLFVRRLEEQQGRKFGDNRALGGLHSLSAPSQVSSAQQPQYQPQNQTIVNNLVAKMQPHEYQNLLRIIESVKGKPYPPVEPPDWMTNPAQRAVWWEGYNRDKAIKEKREADQKAQMEATQYQPMPAQYQPQMSVPQPQSYQQPQSQPPASMPAVSSQPDITQQVQSLLASYSNGNNTNATQQFDYNAWAANAAAQAQAYSAQTQQPRWDANWNENSNPAKAQENANAGSKAKRGFEKREWQESLFDENGDYKGKKKPCRFWREGKCQKGAKCTYLHD